AVTLAFQQFSQAINMVTDSAYVAGLVQRLDKAVLGQGTNQLLFGVMKLLWETTQNCSLPYYILHIKSHNDLLGFIAEGNAQADQLVSVVELGPVANIMQQAIASHQFFHQGHRALKRQFQFSTTEAIVASCPDCQGQHFPTVYGVNPGLRALQIWQTDITHIMEFGRQRYVHVLIDTFSSVIIATAHTGETAKDVIRHWPNNIGLITAFATCGVPQQIKTNNGPAYVSGRVKAFLQSRSASHTTGIPSVP
ncbi:hypothetical protein N303_09928, partial [Cuculus canorus]